MASYDGDKSSRNVHKCNKRLTLNDVLNIVNDENDSESDSGSDVDPRDLCVDDSSDEENVNNGDGNENSVIGGSGDQQWELITGEDNSKPKLHEFIGNPGPNWIPTDAQPVDYFDRFFLPTKPGHPSLWELIIEQTNAYFESYLLKNQVLKQYSKVKLFKPVQYDQIRAFIGLLINCGLVKKHGIREYWDTKSPSQVTPIYRQIFKLETFKLILRFFHLSDSATEPKRGSLDYDPTYKFRPLLEHLNQNWASEYNLGQKVSIDESIVGFKGRHILVNYIRIKKHHQWGPKEYVLADSITGYVNKIVYHTKDLRCTNKGQPYDVCTKLMEPHKGKFHHLVVDNYYTSVQLCDDMFDSQIYVTGTVRANRKYLPDQIKKCMKQKGNLIEMRRSNLLALSWVDRKQVRMLSTYSSAGVIEKTSYDNKVRFIPTCVIDYNSGMGGVDLADMMTDHYAAELKTMKCWKKVAFHLFDRCVTNAYILYKCNPNLEGKPMSHLKFISAVVEGLIGEYREERVRVGRPSLMPEPVRKRERHFIDYIPENKRRKCQVCATDRSISCKGSRVRTWCRDCGVGLCLGDCFRKYHT